MRHAMLAVALLAGAGPGPDHPKLLAAAESTLAEAVQPGPAATEGGVPVEAAVTGMPKQEPQAGVGKPQDDDRFTKVFGEDAKDLVATGSNPFFVLEPGYVLVLEGKDEGKDARITITVLGLTATIGGVEARAVEEREEIGGQLKEVTKDWFAISKRTNNVYYFGEDVDEYKDGKVVAHSGSWRSGEKGAHYGLLMMATPLLGARYYQELAPGVGMDRAEVVSVSEAFECPAGKFTDVLKTEETTPLEPGDKEHKLYARGVGLLCDGGLKLVRYGKGVK